MSVGLYVGGVGVGRRGGRLLMGMRGGMVLEGLVELLGGDGVSLVPFAEFLFVGHLLLTAV